MGTALKSFGITDTKGPEKKPNRDSQLSRDRITGMIVLIIMLVLMGVMIWLASMGEGTQNLDYYNYPMIN